MAKKRRPSRPSNSIMSSSNPSKPNPNPNPIPCISKYPGCPGCPGRHQKRRLYRRYHLSPSRDSHCWRFVTFRQNHTTFPHDQPVVQTGSSLRPSVLLFAVLLRFCRPLPRLGPCHCPARRRTRGHPDSIHCRRGSSLELRGADSPGPSPCRRSSSDIS